MRDALTIVVVHVSRQLGQSLLNVDQCFRLKAGADFLQRVDARCYLCARESSFTASGP